ncbi:MAG: hypothetical protein U9P50_02915 [Patescibacteria group bacterium]|nr:hypothetical protein [Patescibacteria group bacterium]
MVLFDKQKNNSFLVNQLFQNLIIMKEGRVMKRKEDDRGGVVNSDKEIDYPLCIAWIVWMVIVIILFINSAIANSPSS